MVSIINTSNFALMGNNMRFIATEGLSIVLFTQGKSSAVDDIFQSVAMNNGGRILFFKVNLTNNKDFILKSRSSTTPIDNLPYILIYANNNPKAKMKGNISIPTIEQFINGVIQQTPVRTPPSFVQQQNMYGGPQNHGYQQPAYNIVGEDPIDEEDDRVVLSPKDKVAHNMPWLVQRKY